MSKSHPTLVRLARDCAMLLALALVATGLSQLVRRQPMPLITHKAYEILVPCPDVGSGQFQAMPASEFRAAPGDLVIDARPTDVFARGHLPGAINLAYDYLEPTSDAQLRVVAGSGARRVLVYGDGEDPDSGRELARELAGKGIRNVVLIAGGAPALENARGAL